MWICLNNAFFSIVATKVGDANLLVRARRPKDIETIFPGYKATTITRRDYQFRAEIPREVVAKTIAECLLNIDYGNFKDSVRDDGLHDAYNGFWHIMAKVQPQRPYSDYKAPRLTAPTRKQAKMAFGVEG